MWEAQSLSDWTAVAIWYLTDLISYPVNKEKNSVPEELILMESQEALSLKWA